MGTLRCGQCGTTITVDGASHPPLWCSGCGADFKARPAAPAADTPAPVPAAPRPPVAAAPPAPAPRRGGFLGCIPWGDPNGNRLVGVAMLALIFVAPLARLGYQAAYGFEDLDDKADRWTKQPAAVDASAVYVRGKVLPVTYYPDPVGGGHGGRVDQELYWHLPKDLRARTPDEVGTVVWLEVSQEYVGEQRGIWVRTDGFIRILKVTLIDRKTNTRLASVTIRGPDPRKPPPGQARKFAGDMPYPEVVEYLKRLPRKAGS